MARAMTAQELYEFDRERGIDTETALLQQLGHLGMSEQSYGATENLGWMHSAIAELYPAQQTNAHEGQGEL